jgi:mono/diheme cytochrome c family protein
MQRQFLYFILGLSLLSSYNNCGRVGFEAELGHSLTFSSQGKTVCDVELIQTYSETYYPLLSTNCNSCHAAAHGSTDVVTSYDGFMQKGTTLINFKASNPHQGNNVNIKNEIAKISPEWTRAQEAYTSCLATLPLDGSGNRGLSFSLNGKVIPNIAQTMTNQNAWKPVSWDMETEVPTKFVGQFPVIFSIEARYSLYAGEVVGLEFRNPKMRLKSGSTGIQVNGMNVKIDEQIVSGLTTYSNISAYVGATTDTLIAAGLANALAVSPVTDKSLVSFNFINLQSGVTAPTTTTTLAPIPLPTSVTLTQLLNNDDELGVFKQNCLGCHSGPNMTGPFDITVPATAIAKASLIVSRMNNEANPMPKTGQLSRRKIQIVEVWLNGGALP